MSLRAITLVLRVRRVGSLALFMIFSNRSLLAESARSVAFVTKSLDCVINGSILERLK